MQRCARLGRQSIGKRAGDPSRERSLAARARQEHQRVGHSLVLGRHQRVRVRPSKSKRHHVFRRPDMSGRARSLERWVGLESRRIDRLQRILAHDSCNEGSRRRACRRRVAPICAGTNPQIQPIVQLLSGTKHGLVEDFDRRQLCIELARPTSHIPCIVDIALQSFRGASLCCVRRHVMSSRMVRGINRRIAIISACYTSAIKNRTCLRAG